MDAEEAVVSQTHQRPPTPPAKPYFNLKKETKGYVGIDTLQEQIRKKVIKRGFEFNIIVVGRSGLGKSTLVNTLFKANVSNRNVSHRDSLMSPSDLGDFMKSHKTTEIRTTSHIIEEKGVQLRLTITDTPGFGDHINNTNCWLPVLDYINEQYEKYLNEEQSISRKKHIPDTRVHCCLYFIEPTGHSLKPLDIECMRRLDKCVNVVPVIAKSDTMTVDERMSFKRRIQLDLANNGVRVYPMKDIDNDPEEVAYNNKIRDLIPFAVVGSELQYPCNGRSVLGRKTQWGLVEVENRLHCEFADLRDMLIRTHMQDLVEVTASLHYENFRHDRLQSCELNGQHLDISNMNESNI